MTISSFLKYKRAKNTFFLSVLNYSKTDEVGHEVGQVGQFMNYIKKKKLCDMHVNI